MHYYELEHEVLMFQSDKFNHILYMQDSLSQELFERWQKREGCSVQQTEEKTEENAAEEEEHQKENEEIKDNGTPHRYFPPVVGKLKSLKEMRDRVAGNMQSFSQLNHP